jgi:uncharacterized membrane protein
LKRRKLMAHAENEVIINKPIPEVFNFLADGTNNPKWRSGVVSIELASGVSGQVGAQYRQVLKGHGGRNIDGDYKITVAKPNEELDFEVTAGPARPIGSYLFEAVENGTKLKFTLDYQPKGLALLMGPMIARTMKSEVANLANLKQLLESK